MDPVNISKLVLVKNRELDVEEVIIQNRLSGDEADAYRSFAMGDEQEIPIKDQESLFELFLEGNSCRAISKLTGRSLGSILSARIQNGWDDLAKQVSRSLAEKTAQKAAIANAKAVEMLSSLLLATVKENTEKIAQYTITGDPATLGSLRLDSVKDMLKVIEQLSKIINPPQKTPNILINTNSAVLSQQQEPVAEQLPESPSMSDLLKILPAHKKP